MSGSWIVARSWLWPLLAGMGIVGAGCIIGGEKCGANQVELKGTYALCVCEDNAVVNPNGLGCTACGANEEVQNDLCVCKAGFAKAAEGESCTRTDIGASCSAAQACDGRYPYCVESAGAAAYCTSDDCTKNDDCPAQWTCEESKGTRFCQKPRTGLGVPCESNADCAGFDAQYCESSRSHVCQMQGCAAGGAACPNEWGCCDYAALAGMPFSVCVAPSGLTAGACPTGGQLVKP